MEFWSIGASRIYTVCWHHLDACSLTIWRTASIGPSPSAFTTTFHVDRNIKESNSFAFAWKRINLKNSCDDSCDPLDYNHRIFSWIFNLHVIDWLSIDQMKQISGIRGILQQTRNGSWKKLDPWYLGFVCHTFHLSATWCINHGWSWGRSIIKAFVQLLSCISP